VPSRHIDIDGRRWQVYPSGFLTQYVGDEFGLIFVSGHGAERVVRVTRYAPVGARAREQSLAELSDADVERYFRESQTGERSPEAGYHA
jgi:hypothetical protein